MIRTRAQVAKEIHVVTAEIRDKCRVINEEAKDFGRGKCMGFSSGYISEKAERIKWYADDLHRLNKLFADPNLR